MFLPYHYSIRINLPNSKHVAFEDGLPFVIFRTKFKKKITVFKFRSFSNTTDLEKLCSVYLKI